MPTFTPPVVPDTPWTNSETPRLARRLFRHYGPLERGRSVLKVGGAYLTVDAPDQALLATATEVYLGGHQHQVSDAVAVALDTAGYGPYIDPPVTALTTWDSYATVTWGGLASQTWGSL